MNASEEQHDFGKLWHKSVFIQNKYILITSNNFKYSDNVVDLKETQFHLFLKGNLLIKYAIKLLNSVIEQNKNVLTSNST